MKFELHKKFRYDFDWTQEEYQISLLEYLKHLAKINFESSPDLLMFFGLSFFHDTLIEEIKSDNKNIILFLRRDDDFEDINLFLKEYKQSEVEWKVYDKQPILYKCIFINAKLELNEQNDFAKKEIVDSEIDFNHTTNEYAITLSFGIKEEWSFTCTGCTVLQDIHLAKKYLNYNKEFPYCSQCRKKLLTVEQLHENIKEIKKNV